MAPPVASRTRRQQQIDAAVKKYRENIPEADLAAINRWYQFLVRAHLTYPEIEKGLRKLGYGFELSTATRTTRDENAWRRLHRAQRLLCCGDPFLARSEVEELAYNLWPYIEKDLDACHIWLHCLEILRDTGDFRLSPLIVMFWRRVERRDPRNFIRSLIVDATIERKVSKNYRKALRLFKGAESGLYPKRHEEGFVDLYREAIGAIVRLISRHYRELDLGPYDTMKQYVPDLDSIARDIGTPQAKRESFHEKALILMSCDYVSSSYLLQAEDALAECLQQPINSPYHEMNNLRAEIGLRLRQKKIRGAEEKIDAFSAIWERHPSSHDLAELRHLARNYPSLSVPPLPPATAIFPGVLLVRLYQIPSMAVAPSNSETESDLVLKSGSVEGVSRMESQELEKNRRGCLRAAATAPRLPESHRTIGGQPQLRGLFRMLPL